MQHQAGDIDGARHADGAHHLRKHILPSIDHAMECFEGVPPKDIGKLVGKMGQRDLQVRELNVHVTSHAMRISLL